jgi:hypothetical protein
VSAKRSCRAFLNEVFASLIVNPSLVITAFVRANASAARPPAGASVARRWCDGGHGDRPHHGLR